ncbi:hypothetical protein DXA21_21860, partial [Parabacteroides distasonis]
SDEYKAIMETIKGQFPDVNKDNVGVGSTIYAVKPGDGSAREQAASCQKVLGGWANIAQEYATKRYRSNLINWGMLPFIYEQEELPFKNWGMLPFIYEQEELPFKKDDYIFVPNIAEAVKDKKSDIPAYVVGEGELKPFTLKLGEMTDDEREAVKDKKSDIPAYVVGEGELKPFTLKLGEMTDDERDIILKGCLINYNRV